MRFVLLALSLAAVSTAALAAPSPTFQASDLFALEQASDPQIRADGAVVAYVRSSEDIMTDQAHRAVWLIDLKTGLQQPLASGPTASQSDPRWSPDGTRLAYVSTDEDHRPQLFVRWMASGAVARVADLPQAPEDIAWSPDGRQIAFTMLVRDEGVKLGAPATKPEGAKWAPPLNVITRIHYREDNQGYLKSGYDQVFAVSADGGAPRQLTSGEFDASGPLSWTPDGRDILFSSNHAKGWELDPVVSQVFQLSLDSGAVIALTSRHGPDEDAVASPDAHGGDGGRRGSPHPAERSGTVLPGAAAPPDPNRADPGAGSLARGAGGAPVAGRGGGGGDPGLVRPLPHRYEAGGELERSSTHLIHSAHPGEGRDPGHRAPWLSGFAALYISKREALRSGSRPPPG